MTKDTALRLALEALEDLGMKHYENTGEVLYKETFAAIKAALEAKDEPVAWEGGEDWESLAWQLCADECGEEACTELIWEGGPIPEPWGDRWMKYEDEAKRLIALVRKHTTPPKQEAKDEPVAWWIPKHKAPDMVSKVRWSDECEPLYTSPPQRKPLTEKELNVLGAQWHFNLLEDKDKADLFALARAIEAAHGITGENK